MAKLVDAQGLGSPTVATLGVRVPHHSYFQKAPEVMSTLRLFPKEIRMAVTVETLDKLERKITLSLAVTDIQKSGRSPQKMARQVKNGGFRPGKVPAMNVGPTLRLFGSVRSAE